MVVSALSGLNNTFASLLPLDSHVAIRGHTEQQSCPARARRLFPLLRKHASLEGGGSTLASGGTRTG